MGQQLEKQGSKINTVTTKVDRNAEKQSSVMGNALKSLPLILAV